MARLARRSFGEIEERKSRVAGRPPRYRARYQGPDAIRYDAPKTFATIGEADGWLRQVEQRVRLGIWEPPQPVEKAQAPAVDMFADFAEACIVGRMNRPVKPLRASTASNYRKQLRLELVPAFGKKRIDQITEGDVNAWHRKSSAKGHPTQTANAYLFLCSVMNEAVEMRLIAASPCRVPGAKGKPAPKHEAETLTVDELRAYLAAVPDNFRLPLMLGALCGRGQAKFADCEFATSTSRPAGSRSLRAVLRALTASTCWESRRPRPRYEPSTRPRSCAKPWPSTSLGTR